MLAFLRFEIGVVRQVLIAAGRGLHRFYLGGAILAILAAGASYVLGDPASKLEFTVKVTTLTVIAILIALWIFNTFWIPYLNHKSDSQEIASLKKLVEPTIQIQRVIVHDAIHKDRSDGSEFPVKYVQLKVVNTGAKSVVYRPFLIGVQKLDAAGKWIDSPFDHSLPLVWSIDDRHEKQLDPGIPWPANIVRCARDVNRLIFYGELPISIHRYFNTCGKYRLLVGIATLDRPAQKALIEVDNSSDWESFSAALLEINGVPVAAA